MLVLSVFLSNLLLSIFLHEKLIVDIIWIGVFLDYTETFTVLCHVLIGADSIDRRRGGLWMVSLFSGPHFILVHHAIISVPQLNRVV